MNLCCKLVAGVYTPTVRSIPISKDEQWCMREAQFHSAAPPNLAPNQSQTSANQPLDPGSQSGQQKRRVSAKPIGTGANSLLKQAIANRMMPHGMMNPNETTNTVSTANPEASSSEGPAKVHKTDSAEMSKSVLLNPAWYRDGEGRTGYKTSDWEKMSNKQKDVVKENRKKKMSTSSNSGIKELDTDLLSDTSSDKAGSDAKSIDSNISDNAKLNKKALKALEKEKKKQEKEMLKQEKLMKKKQAEEEKKMKKRKSNASEITVENESVELKKIEKKSEKAEATITLTLVSKDKKQPSETSNKSPKEVTEKVDTHKKPSDDPKSVAKDSKEKKDSTERTPTSIRKLKAESAARKSGEPKKTTIGDRRGSSMSEISRVSYKSVTFNDRVMTHEIERNSSISSSEDDAAIMSDDEMTKPNISRKKRIVQVVQRDEEHDDIYDDDDLEDFEEQERLALLVSQGYDVQYDDEGDEELEEDEDDEEEEEDEDALSQNSYYAEDVEGADIYLRNEHGFLEMDMPPVDSRGRRIENYETFDKTMMGSMSKLHGGDDSSGSLLFGYNLPRSASGYFEPPPSHMNFSYEEAILNRQKQGLPVPPYQQQQYQVDYQQQQTQTDQSPRVHRGSPGQLRPTITQRSIYENVDPREVSSQSLILPGSPQSRIQEARHHFFTSTTQTPSNVVSKTIMAASSDGFSIGSTDSDATITAEDEMRRKFVARFGVRKAPIATKEEDPADPKHVMGSQESMNSTDSRESVVSAASIKAEANARRNFNY